MYLWHTLVITQNAIILLCVFFLLKSLNSLKICNRSNDNEHLSSQSSVFFQPIQDVVYMSHGIAKMLDNQAAQSQECTV